jgi:pyruvate/2-oxoglutarate dehydrogenase complex dihydrolipoamide dehydrogenase (E3) component
MSFSAERDQFDVIVIGSGSAGSTTARLARERGRSVAIIEKDQLGGDCPNYACVPTKALLRSAKVYSLLKRANEFGLRPGDVAFDWAEVLAHKDRTVAQTGVASAEERYRQEGTALFRGLASFEDEHHLRVNCPGAARRQVHDRNRFPGGGAGNRRHHRGRADHQRGGR